MRRISYEGYPPFADRDIHSFLDLGSVYVDELGVSYYEVRLFNAHCHVGHLASRFVKGFLAECIQHIVLLPNLPKSLR